MSKMTPKGRTASAEVAEQWQAIVACLPRAEPPRGLAGPEQIERAWRIGGEGLPGAGAGGCPRPLELPARPWGDPRPRALAWAIATLIFQFLIVAAVLWSWPFGDWWLDVLVGLPILAFLAWRWIRARLEATLMAAESTPRRGRA
jgi:hypothetical protein